MLDNFYASQLIGSAMEKTPIQGINEDMAPLDFEDIKRFRVEVPCQALIVPVKQTFTIKQNPLVKKYILRKEQLKNIIVHPENESLRLILLNRHYTKQELCMALKDFLNETGYIMEDYVLSLGYKEMSYNDVLKKMLPSMCQIPGAFERIGHIVHLNLSPEQIVYGKLIGKVILDKHPGIRTVVTKTGKIESEFRTPELELLAGEPDYIAHVVESGLTFYIDFKSVYWNSRLFGERKRITHQIPPHSVVCDVMAGVGAFSMYLAKSGSYVLANDLNKRAVECIHINTERNKLSSFIRAFNMDGRIFIDYCLHTLGLSEQQLDLDHMFCEVPLTGSGDAVNTMASVWIGEGKTYCAPTTHHLRSDEARTAKRPRNQEAVHQPQQPTHFGLNSCDVTQVHFLLNLPQIALEFLEKFQNVTSPLSREIIIHCYCFAHGTTYVEDIHTRMLKSYGDLPSDLRLTHVRDVAPNKTMYCVEFSLPRKEIE